MGSSQLAVVTGASSGIGLELARLFAADGYDLVVVADEAKIHHAAMELAQGGRQVEAIQQDLRDDDAVQHIYDVVSDGGNRVPKAIAFNAGIGRVGGRALFTSSIVAMMPGSYQTMYNASKAFIQSFVEALHDGFRGTGVSVTSLMPGPTDTAFFRRAGMKHTPLARLPFKDDPATTAAHGYAAMQRGEQKVVASSLTSKATGAMLRVLPDSLKALGNRLLIAPFGDH